MKSILITLLYIVVSVLPLAAQSDTITPDSLSAEELWAKGNNEYINGNYSKSIRYYMAIENQGLRSVPLYYNLGNAYFKLGDVAHSMLYYHRALKIEPSNEDTKHNIDVVQSHTKDKIESIPLFILLEWNNAIRSSLSILGWSITSIVAWGGLLLFLLLFLLSRQLAHKKLGFYGALLCAVVLLISTSYAIGERREIVDNHEAIVMSQSLAVKSSPISSSTDLFILHAGTKVALLTTLEGWSKIVIADGRQGWVESRQLEVI